LSTDNLEWKKSTTSHVMLHWSFSSHCSNPFKALFSYNINLTFRKFHKIFFIVISLTSLIAHLKEMYQIIFGVSHCHQCTHVQKCNYIFSFSFVLFCLYLKNATPRDREIKIFLIKFVSFEEFYNKIFHS
jgi:hypothetical protein